MSCRENGSWPLSDAAASAGDLIIATENNHAAAAGEPGRTLANGDLLRIDMAGA
jgi:hypothetical protein